MEGTIDACDHHETTPSINIESPSQDEAPCRAYTDQRNFNELLGSLSALIDENPWEDAVPTQKPWSTLELPSELTHS